MIKLKVLKKALITFFILLILTMSTAYAQTKVITLSDLESNIINELLGRNTDIHITYTGTDSNLTKTLDNLLYKDPYLKSTIKSLTWSYSREGSTYDINIKSEHILTSEQEKLANQKIDEILSSITTMNMNDDQKIKAVHDYIVSHYQYDTTMTNYSHYNLMFDGKSVCNGYATLTYKMLNKLGIKNYLVSGYSNGMGHIWNLIRLDDNYFHLDTTWDDPVPDEAGSIKYNYYMLTDEEILKDHTITDKSSFPEAKVSYYKYLQDKEKSTGDNSYDILIHSLKLDILNNPATSKSDIEDIITNSLGNNPKEITIACTNNVSDNDIKLALQNIYKSKDVQNITYSIANRGDIKVATIYLQYEQSQMKHKTINKYNIYFNLIPTIFTLRPLGF